MSEILQSKHIALLATDGFEDSELEEPLAALRSAGATVTIISEQEGSFTGKNGTEVETDLAVEDAAVAEYDGLLLPGGVENPDTLRMNKTAVGFVQEFFAQHKPVAAICHAPWVLIEAGVVEGRTVTSWPSVRTDLENAGAIWVDKEVVVDDGLVTSRNPGDIPIFCEKMVEEFAKGSSAEEAVS